MEPMRTRAFSLIELLVVIAIIALLTSLIVPAASSLGSSYSLTRQGQLLSDQIVLARQVATSRNRNIEVLLTQSNSNWSVQLWQLDTAGGAAVAARPLLQSEDPMYDGATVRCRPMPAAEQIRATSVTGTRTLRRREHTRTHPTYTHPCTTKAVRSGRWTFRSR